MKQTKGNMVKHIFKNKKYIFLKEKNIYTKENTIIAMKEKPKQECDLFHFFRLWTYIQTKKHFTSKNKKE
jgi:hypothetical protein